MHFDLKSKLVVTTALAVAMFAQSTAPAPVRTEQAAVEQRFIQHLKTLAEPAMEGRGAGTAGLEKAANYIAGEFKKAGLQPAGPRGAYTQDFALTTGAEPGPANRLARSGSDPLTFDKDFRPLSFSSNAKVSGALVFAGYGISAPEFSYDDYANLDVKGKIVLVLRYEPKSFVKGKQERTTFHAHLANKAINARNRGAAAVLLVNTDTGDKPDELIGFGKISGPDDAGIPIVQVKRSVVDKWLKDTTLTALQTKIEADGKPASFVVPADVKLSAQVDITRKQATVHNVLGYLPGRSKEYVVIGAHYDHIGYGHQNSMAPAQAGQVHPGADDNASGTAALIELAHMFSQRRTELDRGVLFMAFAGEELGLLGSARWVKEPTLPLQNAVAMLNMDMIGRMNGSKLYIGGVGSGSTFEGLVKSTAAKYEFTVDQSFRATSSSDHASFLSKGVPSLFFFSGLHKDYHKPSDTWDKVNAVDSAKVIQLVADVAKGLISDDTRPKFARVKAPAQESGSGSGSGGGGGYGPYFGVVPDFAPLEKGVQFADISAGSPAEVAGLQAGDVLTEFAGKPVRDLYDFTFALRASKAGDVVKVKFLRNGKEMSASVKLAQRQ
ncbi:MAG TPA: M28 family peptidase [Bryobacteraceae bacterium]|nr:M28 family peptidase [Bryobacteraceae bacterium]